jgi:hypothetical protein
VSNKKSIANKFICQYTPAPKSSKKTRVVLRRIHKHFPIVHSYEPFTVAQVEDAIKSSGNSTATGPNRLLPEHFKHLGQSALKYLTAVFNLSVRHSVILQSGSRRSSSQWSSQASRHLSAHSVEFFSSVQLPKFWRGCSCHKSLPFFRLLITSMDLDQITSLISEGFKHSKPPKRTVLVALNPTENRKEANVHPQIFFEGALIPLVKNPLDPHHTGNSNSQNNLSNISPGAKIIKAVTNSSFGLSCEDALMTNRATVEPIINQNVPLWKRIVS